MCHACCGIGYWHFEQCSVLLAVAYVVQVAAAAVLLQLVYLWQAGICCLSGCAQLGPLGYSAVLLVCIRAAAVCTSSVVSIDCGALCSCQAEEWLLCAAGVGRRYGMRCMHASCRWADCAVLRWPIAGCCCRASGSWLECVVRECACIWCCLVVAVATHILISSFARL
ncbi:hypothetical protein COO60DRAFT_1501966 [Scenedesmus sp. NREL 46B-D3]|nr:hypothetical protein COO60DRAFT_1501966 [Scenedesmus sp. NREL 46B-D3]